MIDDIRKDWLKAAYVGSLEVLRAAQTTRITELEAQLAATISEFADLLEEEGIDGSAYEYATTTEEQRDALKRKLATARDDALEEAAKVADKHPNWLCGGVKELEQANIHKAAAEDIADAIRALNRRR